MKDVTKRVGRRRLQARLFRIVNVPMRIALRLPFATPLSRQLMLLSYQGSRSGKAYRVPVSYVRDGDTLLTPGGGRWKLNLRSGEAIHIRLRGRDELATPELIGDVDEVRRLLAQMSIDNPRITSFVPVMGSNGQIDGDKLRTAVAHGFRIVRWHVEDLTERAEERTATRARV